MVGFGYVVYVVGFGYVVYVVGFGYVVMRALLLVIKSTGGVQTCNHE